MSRFGLGLLHGRCLPVGRGWPTALLFAAACRPTQAPVPNGHVASHPEASRVALAGALPNRVGVAGSTRGTVACGASRCAAPRESCVLLDPAKAAGAPAWKCVPSQPELAAEQRYACDDASDCADGQACCLGFESAFVAYGCSARSGSGANCALESCVSGEGTPCPVGQVCRSGNCAPVDARATCNGGQRCPASAPICVWTNGVATCAGEPSAAMLSEPSPNELRMGCASPEDCGEGLHCCTNAIGVATSCRVACDMANNLQLCKADADCPAGPHALRCARASTEETAHFPPWVRVCAAD